MILFKLKPKPPAPIIGNTRKTRKYLWFPRVMTDRSIRWLETIQVLERYEKVVLFNRLFGKRVTRNKWVTKMVSGLMTLPGSTYLVPEDEDA
jgi:hypothetical protein